MKKPQELTGPLAEKIFELRGDDIYIAAFSIREYVEKNEMTKEKAYDLAKLSSQISWMRSLRNSAVMGDSVLEHEESSYIFYNNLLEETPGLVEHMIEYVDNYQKQLMEKDPQSWWEQYGRKLMK